MKYTSFLYRSSKTIISFVCILLCLLYPSISLYGQVAYSLETIPNVRLQDSLNHVSNPDNILSGVYVDSINMVLNALEALGAVEVLEEEAL